MYELQLPWFLLQRIRTQARHRCPVQMTGALRLHNPQCHSHHQRQRQRHRHRLCYNVAPERVAALRQSPDYRYLNRCTLPELHRG